MPQPVADVTRPDLSIVNGTGWAAYRTSFDTVEVADSQSSGVILRIERPADRSPIDGRPNFSRTISNFAVRTAAQGDRLALLCGSTISGREPGGSYSWVYGFTVFLWDISSKQLVGSADIDVQQGFTPFVGIANNRVLVTDGQRRQLHLWDADSLAPLDPITIPESLPQPYTTTFGGGRTAAMAGDRFVYFYRIGTSDTELVNVDLADGQITALPMPDGFNGTNVGSSLAMNASHLLFECRTGSPNSQTTLVHYDLESSEITATTRFPDTGYYPRNIRPVVSPDGHWHATIQSGSNSLQLLSGSSAADPYEAIFPLGTLSEHVGDPYAIADGEIWFYPNSPPPQGVVAFRMATGGLPEARLSARALPCHESDGVLQIEVTTTPVLDEPVTFRVRTNDGSATAPDDYQETDDVFSIPAGEGTRIVQIPLNVDQTLEPNESLFLGISEASSNVIVTTPRVPGVIRGTSFKVLPPVAPWAGSPDCFPHSVSLAGGFLVQTNFTGYTPPTQPPAVFRRPFGSGEWTASNSWGRTLPLGAWPIKFLGQSNGRLLMREYNAVSVYDPAADDLLFRLTSQYGTNGEEALSGTHVVSDMTTEDPTEYSLDPPHDSRALTASQPFPMGIAAYTRDFLVMTTFGKGLDAFSRIDGSHVGRIFNSGPWASIEQLAAEDQLLAVASSNRVWICNLDEGAELKELVPLAAPFYGAVNVEVSGGRIFVTDRGEQGTTVIRVFEAATGVEVDSLLEDIDAMVLPDAAPLPSPDDLQSFQLRSFAVDGTDMVASFHWASLHIARLSNTGLLPSFRTPEPVREGESNLLIRLSEAAPWPLTVTSRVIASGSNQEEDWVSSATTTVVPAGAVSFAPGLELVDDHLPEVSYSAALEFEVTANGVTEFQRVSVRVLDNDLIHLADIPQQTLPMRKVFAPAGSGWAYRVSLNPTHAVAWTEDNEFLQTSPLEAASTYSFANHMAGANGWLAVTQEPYGGKLDDRSPSRVYIYRPEDQRLPLYFLKGAKAHNRFGDEMFAAGDFLWIGAPGSEGLIGEGKKSPGRAYLYDLKKRKRIKSYKPPKGLTMSFGEAITANEESVWISAPRFSDNHGVICQFSRDKGKRIRTLLPPESGSDQYFGSRMVATNDLLITSSLPVDWPAPIAPGSVHGYSADTGEHLWSIGPGDGTRRGDSLAILPGNILAVGGAGIFFYQLIPGPPPV